MRAYFKSISFVLRRNKYFFIGCLIGITLSLVSMPVLNTCGHQPPTNGLDDYDLLARVQQWYTMVENSDFEPVILQPTTNHTDHQSANQLTQLFSNEASMIRDKKLKFYRPRFHTTELKIKSKLLLCILIRRQFLMQSLQSTEAHSPLHFTRQLISETIHSLNSQFIDYKNDDILYFYPQLVDDQVPWHSHNLVVSFTDGHGVEILDNPLKLLDHVMMIEYLRNKNKLTEYSFALLLTESTLLYLANLVDFLHSITVSDYVFSVSDGVSVDVASRTKYIRDNLFRNDSILNNGWLVSSTWLSRCSTRIQCCLELIGNSSDVIYWHKSINLATTTDYLHSQSSFDDYISLFPRTESSADLWYSWLAFSRIAKLKDRSKQIELDIGRFRTESNCSREYFEWPLGVPSAQRPSTRFEVVGWTYWNQSHSLMPNEIQVSRRLNRFELAEVASVKLHCAQWTRMDSQLVISNLYRKFDAVRGLEYIVDVRSGDSFRRFRLLKPLNQVELITDIPAVSENMRISMILPVRGHREVPLAIKFLQNYANICVKNPNHQTMLIIALIHTRPLANQTLEVNEDEEFARVKKVSLFIQSKLNSNSVKIIFLDIRPPEPSEDLPYRFPSELVYLDVIARSLRASSTTEPLLLLHCRSNSLLSTDFLSRVRVNTLSGKQVFLPMPFVEYRLRTTISNSGFQQLLQQSDFLRKLKSEAFDVRKENGYFDESNFEVVSFYLHDYLAARKCVEVDIPIVRNQHSLVRFQRVYYNSSWNLHHLFATFHNRSSKLILMRAVEPELLLTHESALDECHYFESNHHSLHSCRHRQIFGLTSKQKLASLVAQHLPHR